MGSARDRSAVPHLRLLGTADTAVGCVRRSGPSSGQRLSLSDVMNSLRLGMDASSEISVAMSQNGPVAAVILAALSMGVLIGALVSPRIPPKGLSIIRSDPGSAGI